MLSPDGHLTCECMTLRDYFAIRVLAAVLSDREQFVAFAQGVPEPEGGGAEFLAEMAYVFADSMLKAREAA